MTRPHRPAIGPGIGSTALGAGATGTIMVQLAANLPQPYSRLLMLLWPAVVAFGIWLVAIIEHGVRRRRSERALKELREWLQSPEAKFAPFLAEELRELVTKAVLTKAQEDLAIDAILHSSGLSGHNPSHGSAASFINETRSSDADKPKSAPRQRQKSGNG
jgi:hypothetical protein